ncbi:hypothetical protein GCM10025871_31880 [Deinococcus metallilatus]|nr:hypothetical protein GCM10025871_31880 [Deinococcus metallilatus]
MVLKGRVVSARGLASYRDPVTGKQRRRSVSCKTHEEAERVLRALLRTLPKAKPVQRRPAANLLSRRACRPRSWRTGWDMPTPASE